jgi:hypothetical protein
MNPHRLPRLPAAILACASITLLAAAARAEDTSPVIERKGTYSASNGASGTTSSATTLSKGAAQTRGTWTNAAGGTGNWQGQRTWNKANHTGAYSGTAARPNGATSSWQGTTTRTAPGVYSSGGTITLANGKQVIVKGTDTRTAPGVWQNQQVITTPAGKTIDRTVDTTLTPGNAASTATSMLPDGQTVSGSANLSVTQAVVQPPAPGK